MVPLQVEEDETLHQHDLDMTDFNGEGDGNDGVEGLDAYYEFLTYKIIWFRWIVILQVYSN